MCNMIPTNKQTSKSMRNGLYTSVKLKRVEGIQLVLETLPQSIGHCATRKVARDAHSSLPLPLVCFKRYHFISSYESACPFPLVSTRLLCLHPAIHVAISPTCTPTDLSFIHAAPLPFSNPLPMPFVDRAAVRKNMRGRP